MSEIHIYPDELRQIAARLRSRGSEWDAVNEHLRHTWERLDSGWESYAKEEVTSTYVQTSETLAQLGNALYQAAWALEAAAAWIEDADQKSAASFVALQHDWGMLPKPNRSR